MYHPGVPEAISRIARVLQLNGRLVFFELGLATDARVQCWQVRVKGIYLWLQHRALGRRGERRMLRMFLK
jgi:hypothetical protein